MKNFEMPVIEVISFTSEEIMDGSTLPDVDNGMGWH